ncbi:hypothetical protein STRCI_008280 [Streptomyces cinnabarinus]|uniref:Uncharacterized protein n=1 Tax=Streptomyces cinnabarinus TaxID=67287 RepID=A0ABY7KQ24_9ACTN|nr:hypothetical protein [Streptomyces cinnabarinus]WAZ26669.1 hypothetical protein STRCI_008280 [Streptomyces cinnabarinus]
MLTVVAAQEPQVVLTCAPAPVGTVIYEARGNPLALLELSQATMPGPWPRRAGPDPQAVTRKIEEAFLERVASLPDATRLLLLVAAAEPLGDAPLRWRAADRLNITKTAAVPAHAADLLEIGVRVRFRHPLVRSAVYTSASLSDRRRAHAALAQSTSPTDDPDRRAWHSGQAASGPDENAAADLEASADGALARGWVSAAGAFLELSATLPPEPELRINRTLRTAQAMRDAGAPQRALSLLSSIDTGVLKPLHSVRADWLRAQIAYEARRDDAAVSLLLQAAYGGSQRRHGA